MKFRPYQNEMDDAIYEELIIKNNDRCLIKAFCGTGKSIVMYKGKAFQNHDTIVYVFPSLSLIDQFKTDYLKSAKVLVISSDDDSTTDETTIKQYMKNKNKIICITYQSFHLLTPYKINMCVFDEAHHAVGETYQKIIFNPNIEKSCFFTATPKCANGIDMVKDCNLVYEYSYLRGLSEGYLNPFEIRCDLVGDDSNKTIYESIARAYYTTGNNRILTFHSDVNTESPTSVRNFVNENEMQKAFKTIAKEFSKDSKKVIKLPKIKMIGFYSEIKLKERRQILNEFDSCKDVYILCSCETMGEGVDTKNANMCVFVDSKTSVTKIIQNIGRVVRKVFGINKPHSTILLPMTINKTKYESCQTAEECDAVIRQVMNKDGHNDFTSILNVLSALKQEDEELYDICLHYPNEYSPQEIEENLKSQGYKIGEEVDLDEVFERANINQELDIEEKDEDEEPHYRVDIHTNSLEEPIVSHGSGDKIINILKDDDNYYEIGEGQINPPKQRIRLSVHTNSDIKVLWKVDEINFGSCLLDCEVIDNWNERLEELRSFLEKEKRRPSQRKISEKKIANWLFNNLHNYRNKIKNMKDESKYNLFSLLMNEYNELLKTNDDRWLNNLQLLKEFINKNKRKPSKIKEDEKKIAEWMGDQLKRIHKGIRLEWNEFIKEYKEYFKTDDELWKDKLNTLDLFMIQNKKRPFATKEDEQILALAQWLNKQNIAYSNNDFNVFRIKEWNIFLEKHESLLKTKDEIWNENLKRIKNFINKNKRRPYQKKEDEKILGKWLSTQLTEYKKNKNGIHNDRLKQWEEFIEEYKQYLKTDDEIWNDLLFELKQFLDKNKRTPNRRLEKEKILGSWLGNQNKTYKTKNHGFKDLNRCKQWEEFLEEYKQYFTEKKSMKLQPKTESESKENPQQIQRTNSEISELHKDYKTKRSDNLHEEFQEDPEKWHHYHEIAELNEHSFPTESIPRNQIIQELEKIKTRRPKHVIDMGCGKAFISKHFEGDTRFKFTNIDHVAIDETVQSGDISKLSFEDDSVEICILSLAMWGSNCKDYISEAHRVLETNGTLYIIEPTKRWTNEIPADRLKELLNNFTIKKEIIEKFTMFVAIKN